MTDIMLGLRDGENADASFWPGGSRQSSQIVGRVGTNAGHLSEPTVAPDWLHRLVAYLRQAHPIKTADAVSDRCRGRVSASQVGKWLNRGTAPGGEALLWLATAYGPSLLVACFGPSPVGRPDWLSLALQVERAADIDRRMRALRDELDDELALLGRRL